MKYFCFLIVLILIGSAVFAIGISVTGEIETDFNNISPVIGAEVNFEKIDILAGLGYSFNKNKTSYKDFQTFNTDNTSTVGMLKMYIGVAPKISGNEKITFSFPILAELQIANASLEFEKSDVVAVDSAKEAEGVSFILDIGGRLSYILTERWSVYAGAFAQVFSITNSKLTIWKNIQKDTFTVENNVFDWFNSGKIEFGVRLTFPL